MNQSAVFIFADWNVTLSCFGSELATAVPAWYSIVDSSISLQLSFLSCIDSFSKNLLLHPPSVIYFRSSASYHNSIHTITFTELIKFINELMITFDYRHLQQAVFYSHIGFTSFHENILTYLLVNSMHILDK